MIESLKATFEKIDKITGDKNKICELLTNILNETIDFNAQILKLKPVIPIRQFQIDVIDETYGISIGINRSEETIAIADWLFVSKLTRSTSYLLYFIIVKESLLHFVESSLSEIDEALLNIISILWLKEFFEINTLDNPMYKAIDHRIYTKDIAGYHYLQFVNFTRILFVKNISFQEIFKMYFQTIRDESLTDNEFVQKISKWIFSLISEEDVLAPIFLKERFVPTLNYLIKFGSEEGNAENIAKELDLHPNSIRKQFRGLLENYNVFWRPIINMDMLKLHNYFLKVIVKNESLFDIIYDIIWKIPYNKSVYLGEYNDYKIIYCPSLTCPHLVSEQLNSKLTKLLNSGDIFEYNLQLIRERFHYGAITTKQIEPSIDYFQSVLLSSKLSESLYPYTFAHEVEDFSMEFDDKDKILDFNLLYFFSILRGKYLLKQGFNVNTSELPKLYEINDIPIHDTYAQSIFLSKIELRAKKRGILSYAFFMRSYAPRARDVLILEIPVLNKRHEESVVEITKQIQKFSFLGQITISDRCIFTIPGINHQHPISEVIKEMVDKQGLESTSYTISLKDRRVVALHDLYDFKNQKWQS